MWLASALPAGAQGVGLAVEMPLGGYYRAGSWIPVNCALTNQGPAAEVQINAQVQQYGPNPAVHTYELSASLPSPAYRRYSLYVKPPGYYGTRPLEVQLLQDGRVIAKQEPTLTALNEGDRLVAVITPEEGRFGGLAGTHVSPTTAPVIGYRQTNRNPGQVQVAYVKPELAPDRDIGYQIADLIILSGLTSGALSPAQEQALTRWVQAGGTLIVAGGADSGALQTPAMRALLPVQITGTTTLDAAGALRSLAVGAQVAAIPGAGGRFVAAASRPKPGASVIAASSGVPLLCSWPVGAGEVLFLAADPARPPLRGWDGLTGILRHYLLHPPRATFYLSAIKGATTYGGMGSSNAYGGYGTQQSALADACLQVSQMDVPGFAFIGFFLVSYLVVLVPVNYYFLKRRDRRELAWVTTPAIILAFSGLAYGVGYGTKGGQVILAQAGVVEAWSGQRAAPALTYFGLFSPHKTRYDLAAEDGTVALMPAETGDGASRRPLRIVEGDAFGLKDVPVDMWDMGLFQSDSVLDLGEGFQCELKQADGMLTGRVTNRTPFDLEDAALMLNRTRLTMWGTLRRGETRTINAAWTPGGAGSSLPSAALQTVQGTTAAARMRRALIEPLTSGNLGGNYAPPGGYPGAGAVWRAPDHPVLMGWVNQPLVPVHVDGHPVRDQSAHLFLVHLTVR